MKNFNALASVENTTLPPQHELEQEASETLSSGELFDRQLAAQQEPLQVGFEEIKSWQYLEARSAPLLKKAYSAAELREHPELRFNVNPNRFPIFNKQAGLVHGEAVTLGINETLRRHASSTADLIAVLSGEARGSDSQPATDIVIYLDKSARPVSWLVNAFWDKMTVLQRRPDNQYLAIDRVSWLRAAGIPILEGGNFGEDWYGYKRGDKPPSDIFKIVTESHPISPSSLARIRLKLIPNGITAVKEHMSTEEITALSKVDFIHGYNAATRQTDELPEWLVNKIFATPTGLEGKVVTIVDEVQNSGSTLEIAKQLVAEAVADDSIIINGATYWSPGSKLVQTRDQNETQMGPAPVWYDKDTELGRGIGDVDPATMRRIYEENPTDENLTNLIASPVVGRPLRRGEDPKSVELGREIEDMTRLFDTGHIMVNSPNNIKVTLRQYSRLGLMHEVSGKMRPDKQKLEIIWQQLESENH